MSTDDEKMAKIKEILLKHKGKKHCIKSKVIATRVGVSEDATHIGTRSLITKLVKQGLPIGACDNGYFLMETQKEVDEYTQILNNRIEEIYDRKGRMQSNFNRFYVKRKKTRKKPQLSEEDADIL